MRNKLLLILTLCCMAANLHAGQRVVKDSTKWVYYDSIAGFSMVLPTDWQVEKDSGYYLLYTEQDYMFLTIIDAKPHTVLSPFKFYDNLKKGDEEKSNIKCSRHLMLTMYRHYLTCRYTYKGEVEYQDYFRVFPKKVFFFKTRPGDRDDVKLAIARSTRVEPWNYWTQFNIMWKKLGWLISLIFIFGWAFFAYLTGSTTKLGDSGFWAQMVFILVLWLLPLFFLDGDAIILSMYCSFIVLAVIGAIVERTTASDEEPEKPDSINKNDNTSKMVKKEDALLEKIIDFIFDKIDTVMKYLTE